MVGIILGQFVFAKGCNGNTARGHDKNKITFAINRLRRDTPIAENQANDVLQNAAEISYKTDDCT